ncbi:hypothetical protein [Stenotrophomonas hibiscicola]|uniref:hypothetical protein n=1 Tax=Stenotrophomonas hibiscicola TaxID=86189 RepID=UPI002E78C1C0|nr:hypothetical protein [[Pseudomonas] hibiscicola]
MTYEEFVLRNQKISESLDAIAKRTANMAWVGTAHSNNPEFVELMKAQEVLILKAEQLLDAITASSKGG